MKTILIVPAFLCAFCFQSRGQSKAEGDSVMVTIFLKHQQDKNLDSLQAIQKKNKFGNLFPPERAWIVSWYMMMGVGQTKVSQ